MGLSRQEQIDNFVIGLNDVCYGALRYGWKDKAAEQTFRDTVAEMWSLLETEFHCKQEDIAGIIGVGRIFNLGALQDALTFRSPPTPPVPDKSGSGTGG